MIRCIARPLSLFLIFSPFNVRNICKYVNVGNGRELINSCYFVNFIEKNMWHLI